MAKIHIFNANNAIKAQFEYFTLTENTTNSFVEDEEIEFEFERHNGHMSFEKDTQALQEI